jgi:hypothetical protein
VRSFVAYSGARLLLFVAVGSVLYALGFRGFPLVAVALVLSLPLSYVLLSRQRAALGADIERRLAERRDRTDRLRAQLRGDDKDREDQPG